VGFLFARNFISESLLVVGQILITKEQAFDFNVGNNQCKNGKKKKSTILDTGEKVWSRKLVAVKRIHVLYSLKITSGNPK
jgi:hypothetical protein